MKRLTHIIALAGLFAVSGYAQTSGAIDAGTGIRIHYLASGKKSDRAPLLFIPGWTFPARVWQAQVDYFGKERLVIAIDPRSQGESTKTDNDNTPEARARDLQKVVDGLRLNKPVLIGWSQGVQDVAAYVEQFGADKMSGFILVDAAFSAGPSAPPQQMQQLLHLVGLYSAQPKEYYDGMFRFIMKHQLPAKQADQLKSDCLRTPVSIGLAMLVTDLLTVDRRAAIKKMSKPTLIIAAEQSDDLTAMQEMQQGIPGAKLEVVRDAGHAVFLDQPAEFNHLLDSFLYSLDL